MNIDDVCKRIKNMEVGVIPTDTVYGLVCSALIPESVELMYEIKNRDKSKPFVYLINKIDDLEKLGIVMEEINHIQFSDYWPGPVSLILPTKYEYMHRGKGSVAVRLPLDTELRNLISTTGPLASSSCNIESGEVSRNITEAKKYFSNDKRVTFYVDNGDLDIKSSKIIDPINNLIIRN